MLWFLPAYSVATSSISDGAVPPNLRDNTRNAEICNQARKADVFVCVGVGGGGGLLLGPEVRFVSVSQTVRGGMTCGAEWWTASPSSGAVKEGRVSSTDFP